MPELKKMVPLAPEAKESSSMAVNVGCSSRREKERDEMPVCKIPGVHGHASPHPTGAAFLGTWHLKRGRRLFKTIICATSV